MLVQSLGWKDPLEEEMATRSNILVWRIPWTEEPGGLRSVGLQRVGHNWCDFARIHSLKYYDLGTSLVDLWLRICLPEASLVTQWRIHLPVEETWVLFLIWEDPTCLGTIEPIHHNYWACALELRSRNYSRLQVFSTWAMQQEKPPQWQAHVQQWQACATQLQSSPHSPQLEKNPLNNEDPAQTKN